MGNKIWQCDICKKDFLIEDQKPNKFKEISFCNNCKKDMKIPIIINRPVLRAVDRVTIIGIFIIFSIIMIVGLYSNFQALEIRSNLNKYTNLDINHNESFDFENDNYGVGISMYRLAVAIQSVIDDNIDKTGIIQWNDETINIMYGLIENDIFEKSIYQKADRIIKELSDYKILKDHGGINEQF